jgi:nucleoside phosphorylase
MSRQLRREDYTVGWVCALSVELAAAKLMLDEEHEYATRTDKNHDHNIYCMGSIKGHNIVIVCLPEGCIGTNPAAVVATQMQEAFRNIRFGLMVGIGGGVPSREKDIRLGDVVVSKPDGNFGGVVQYDFVKDTPTGYQRTGMLNTPQILLSSLSSIQAGKMVRQDIIRDHLSILEREPEFRRSQAGADVLFRASYDHESGLTSCENCKVEFQVARLPREKGKEVSIHYGTIASGNQLMKYAADRDKVSANLGGVCCFEMEAAGLMNSFPCLVIRGISDYADSHKNSQWQAYAAGTAAAYAKGLLREIPADEVMETVRVEEVMSGARSQSIGSTADGSNK